MSLALFHVDDDSCGLCSKPAAFVSSCHESWQDKHVEGCMKLNLGLAINQSTSQSVCPYDDLNGCLYVA